MKTINKILGYSRDAKPDRGGAIPYTPPLY